MERYLCVHGHFYQPPRENPWLEAIELQDSAYPYHDWNERITAECYEPNAASRILDGQDRILQIVNNYGQISFNFGPTLLSWLEVNDADVYRAVLDADRASRDRFSGHGSAMAQVYNHMIMPLANRRDKRTQVAWGVRDFQQRFGRTPEGMWLAETAVDLETLDILAEFGIGFTVLAPSQAEAVREPDGTWTDVTEARIDPTMPYRLHLESGRSIALFFYDGPISRAVAFEGLLSNGERFAHRLLDGFSEERDWPQMVHIATDGETYGHHHQYGEMALSYALHYIESQGLARLTNYGEYLEKHPPRREVRIIENTSWSCIHGVERWRSDCGCNSGGRPNWKQTWRQPLRHALDLLRDRLAPHFEEKGRDLLADPWRAREDFIRVVLDRQPESIDRFFADHAIRALSPEEKVRALKLLELERHAMLMYTSCGWFFDEISGIETVQVLQYAGRAIQLAQELFGDRLEESFLGALEAAPSNLPELGNGRTVYERFVRPAMVDFEKVGAHYGVSSLFEPYEETARIYSYTAHRLDYRVFQTGISRLALGRAEFISEVTRESHLLSFGVLHFGDHNLNGGVREFQGDDAYAELLEQAEDAFSRADFPEIIRLFDRHFGESNYSLKSLFRDEQRKIVRIILQSTISEAEAAYRQVYEHHAPLMRFLADLGIRMPGVLRMTAEFVLNSSLRLAFEDEVLDLDRIRSLLETAEREQITLKAAGLAYTLEQTLERLMSQFRDRPVDLALLEKLEAVTGLVIALPFEVRLWKPQNIYYETWQRLYGELAGRSDEESRAWVRHFQRLGENLSVRLPES
jgi:alpha-amylase/alpha-mannosidase (GH57 family)